MSMQKYKVDRGHTVEEIEKNNGNFDQAVKACVVHAKFASEQLIADAIIPTQSPPNVTPQTWVMSILGVDDGLMVSDFYSEHVAACPRGQGGKKKKKKPVNIYQAGG